MKTDWKVILRKYCNNLREFQANAIKESLELADL